jgi:hypothetical protein
MNTAMLDSDNACIWDAVERTLSRTRFTLHRIEPRSGAEPFVEIILHGPEVGVGTDLRDFEILAPLVGRDENGVRQHVLVPSEELKLTGRIGTPFGDIIRRPIEATPAPWMGHGMMKCSLDCRTPETWTDFVEWLSADRDCGGLFGALLHPDRFSYDLLRSGNSINGFFMVPAGNGSGGYHRLFERRLLVLDRLLHLSSLGLVRAPWSRA